MVQLILDHGVDKVMIQVQEHGHKELLLQDYHLLFLHVMLEFGCMEVY